MNWVTVGAGLVIVGSVLAGLHRRFGRELQTILYQLAALLLLIVSVWVSWIVTQQLAHRLFQLKIDTWPKFIHQLMLAWHNNPTLGTWILFILCYFAFSAIAHRIVRVSIGAVSLLIPNWIAKSKILGGFLGALAGCIRVMIYGGILFLGIQYLTLPRLANQARTSTPFSYLAQTVYRPFLQPLVARALPVLASNALGSVSKSISLFAIPSGTAGQEQGVLLVPSAIHQLATQITANASSPQQKAYLLYEWEIHHVAYDWHKYNDYVVGGKWDQQSPLQTLTTGKGVCADYALLYADLAHAAGLTVEIVEGMGGTSGQVGSHAWNQVWDPTEQRFLNVDTTWGHQQDMWFDVANGQFNRTHFSQMHILIKGGIV